MPFEIVAVSCAADITTIFSRNPFHQVVTSLLGALLVAHQLKDDLDIQRHISPAGVGSWHSLSGPYCISGPASLGDTFPQGVCNNNFRHYILGPYIGAHCGVGSRDHTGQAPHSNSSPTFGHLYIDSYFLGVGSPFLTGPDTLEYWFISRSDTFSLFPLANCGVGSRHALTGLARWDNFSIPFWIYCAQLWDTIKLDTDLHRLQTEQYDQALTLRIPGAHCGVGSRLFLTGQARGIGVAFSSTGFTFIQLFAGQFVPGVGSLHQLTGPSNFCDLQSSGQDSTQIQENPTIWSVHPAHFALAVDFLTATTGAAQGVDSQTDCSYTTTLQIWLYLFLHILIVRHRRLLLAFALERCVFLSYFLFNSISIYSIAFSQRLRQSFHSITQLSWTALKASLNCWPGILQQHGTRRDPGPNSRGSSSFFRPFWPGLAILLGLVLMVSGNCRNEGSAPAMGSTEVPFNFFQGTTQLGTKQHGNRPPACFGTSLGLKPVHPPSVVVKRSLHRAQRRATTHGMAWYRGKCLTPESFERMGLKPIQWVPDRAKKPLPPVPVHHPKRRLTFFHWNGGGLAFHTLDEIKAWLKSQQIGIGIISETRWCFQNLWADSEWTHVHTGDLTRSAGVLILISTSICNPDCVKWQEVSPGRLLHVRLELEMRNVDVIGCYQHTWNRQTDVQSKRDKWWSQLDDLLSKLPRRNQLMILGDFNCSMQADTIHCGTTQYRWEGKLTTGTRHPDQHRFHHLIRTHHLTILNSWDASRGPTFIGPSFTSRIDFACMRHAQADGASKQIQYIWTAPFQPMPRSGHVALVCHASIHWHPPHPKVSCGITRRQKALGRQARFENSHTWQDFVQAAAPALTDSLAQVRASADRTITDLHHVAVSHFKRVFIARPPSPHPTPSTLSEPHFHHKWYHRKQIDLIHHCTPANVIRVWHHVVRFCKLKRAQRKIAKQHRHMQFQNTMQEAMIAATKQDTHSLFTIINRNAPKVPLRRMQLRNSTGTIATPVEARAILIAYVRDTWKGTPLMSDTASAAPGVPFALRDLVRALADIPPLKAVALPYAPGMIWGTFAEHLAPFIFSLLEQWWGQSPPIIPQCWKDGWLHFLPKPMKAPVAPGNLRPICLQEPIGKALVGILTKIALHQAMPEISKWPLWAYVPQRTTQDAIRKVSSHCLLVRTMMKGHRSTPHNRATSQPRYPVFGGLQIFIDLERAFDSIDRVKLFGKLTQLGIHANISQLLREWHVHTRYHVMHNGETIPIDTSKGLRQGCKAAPLLWNCLVVLMLHSINQHLPSSWICNCLCVYADDFHICGTFRSEEEFCQLLFAIGIVFQTLRDFDLTMNPHKSIAVMTMQGTASRRIRATHVRRRENGEELLIPIAHDHICIPIHTQAKYLGCVMSYQQFEDQTLWHRTTLARVGFTRLRHWLCSRRGFSLTRRIQLWRSCVLPIFQFGIFSTGVTLKGLHHAFKHLHSMLRQMAHDHAYISGNTHEQVAAKFQLPSPAHLLHLAVDQLLRSVTQRNEAVHHTDLARQLQWEHLQHVHALIDEAQATDLHRRAETALHVEVSMSEHLYHCQQCPFKTSCVASFRRHCTQIHGTRMSRIQHVQAAAFMTNGLPECRFCHKKFTTWRSFYSHIECGCQALIPGPEQCDPIRHSRVLHAAGLMPPSTTACRGFKMLTTQDQALLRLQPWGERILQIVETQETDRLIREKDACKFLASRCFICGMQIGRTQEQQQHFRSAHPDYWSWVPQKAIMLTNLHCTDTPCDYCGNMFKIHTCPVWTQISIMITHGAGRDQDAPDPQQTQVHHCDICHMDFQSTAELTQHLQSAHKLAGLTFNAARDCLDSQAVCAHCGTIYGHMESLRSHITQGRCGFFNPDATPESKPLEDQWIQACFHGTLPDIIAAPRIRMHLTLHCIHCHQVYTRAGDLSNHLMTGHARLWRQAQRLTKILNALMTRCVCNPQIHQMRGNHQCVLIRQLAMAQCRMPQVPFAPMPITEQTLANLISSKVPRDSRFCLSQVLSSGALERVWTLPALRALLRSQCFLCGQVCAPDLLCKHLREAHHADHVMTCFYMDHLLDSFQQCLDSDFQCIHCNQVFNLPPADNPVAEAQHRLDRVVGHFRGNCPNLLQASLIFAAVLNGGRLGDGRTGCPSSGTGARSLPVPAECDGPESQARPESTGAKAATKRRKTGPPTQGPGTGAGHTDPAVPSDNGQAATEARRESERAAKHRLFYPVLPPRTHGSPEVPPRGDAEVAPGQDCSPSEATAALAPAPDADTAHRRPEQGEQGGIMYTDGSSAGGVQREESDPGGHELAFSEVGPSEAIPGAGSKATNHHEGHDSDLARIAGHVPSPDIGSPLPRDGDQHQAGDSAMEVATESTTRPAIRVVDDVDIFVDMDFGGNKPETSHTGSKWTCSPAQTDDFPRPGEGAGEVTAGLASQSGDLNQAALNGLRHSMTHLILLNDHNWCYANTTFYGLNWALACQHTVKADFWGEHFSDVAHFLLTAEHDKASLANAEWFASILESGGFTHSQQDCAECIHAMLQWLLSPIIDMRWERRIETADGILQHDQCAVKTMPILLQFTPSQAIHNTCMLQDLVNTWHQADSMKTGLLTASEVVCVHIDRMYETQGCVTKSSCAISLESEVTFPVFSTGHALTCEMICYIPVAAAFHLGEDRSGHYQAILKIQPTVLNGPKPANWLITQDNDIALPVWGIPQTFAATLTVVWLIRSDCLQLPTYMEQLLGTSPTAAPDELANDAPANDDVAAEILALIR